MHREPWLIAEYAEFRFPPPPRTFVRSCAAALTEYTSAVVPARTSVPPVVEVTRAMVLRLFSILIATICVWSAKTAMPATDCESYPLFSAVSVYSSGLSETKA